MTGFFAGAGAFFEGMGFVVSTPRTWPRALVPMATAIVLFGGLAALGVWGALVLGAASTVFAVVLAIAAVLLALVAALAFAQPLSGWALDGIVHEQRASLGLPPLRAASTGAAMASSLLAALLALAVGAPVVAVLTVVGWLVPPAIVVTVPKVCAGALLGFGLAAMLLLAIPVLGLLAIAFGVAGATRLHATAERTGLGPGPQTNDMACGRGPKRATGRYEKLTPRS